MKQALSFLLAIFAPLGSLVRVLEPMLAWLAAFEATLNDPRHVHDLRMSAHGRRTVEGAVAFGEYLANIMVACRTAELLGLRASRVRIVLAHKRWEPRKARDWSSLMQRYARMKHAFSTLERDARRRAARIRREIARGDATGLVAPAPHAHLTTAPFALLCALIAGFVARFGAAARGPPPVIVLAASV
jgi:hypothetical protein